MTTLDGIPISDHECDVTGNGPPHADVLLLGIAPGRDEATKTKQPFTGAAGRMLNATVEACGYNRDKIYTTNLICWWNDKPTPDEIRVCLPRLMNEIVAVHPKLIVTAGTIVNEAFFKQILGWKKIPPRGALTWCAEFDCWVMRTHHPAAFTYDDSKVDIAEFARDMLKLKDVITWKREPRGPVPYTVVQTVEEAEQILWNIAGFAALDVETSYDFKGSVYEQTVDPDEVLLRRHESGSCMLCFSIACNRGVFVFPGLVLSGVWAGVRADWAMREEVKWITHNGMFDRGQLINLLNEKIHISEDTLLMSYSLDERGGAQEEDERPTGIHGLKGLAREYLGVEPWDKNVLECTPDELHEYNAHDAAYTLELFHKFRVRQDEDDVRKMYETLLIRSADVFSDCQLHGVYIDRAVLNELALEWLPEAIQLEDELKEEAYEVGWPRDTGINLASWPDMHKFVYDVLQVPYGPHGRTTRKEVIDELVETSDNSWLRKLKRWRSVTHKIANYIVGIEDDIKYDGRAHAFPVLHGARTGRIAYKRPPLMTIPNKGVDPEQARLRKAFAATPESITGEEMVLIEADYKQAEFWATWMLSQDPALLEALLTGDIHGATALEVFEGVTKEHEFWDIYRFMCKTLGFGVLYGRGENAFVTDTFRGRAPPEGFEFANWDLAKARAFIKKYSDKYPVLWKWRKDVVRKALRDGEQTSVTGRKRRYWLTNFKTVNQSVNFNSQALGHDHLLSSFDDLHEPVKALHRWSHLWFEVHDAIVCETPRRLLDETCALIKSVMEAPKFGMEYGIPVDIKYGPNWYDTVEWKEPAHVTA